MKPLIDRASARRLAIGLAIGFVVSELVGFTGIAEPPDTSILTWTFFLPNPFVGAAYLGTFAMYVAANPRSWARRALEVFCGVGSYAIVWYFMRPEDFDDMLGYFGQNFAFVAIVGQVVEIVRAPRERRRQALCDLVGMLALPLYVIVSPTALGITATMHPTVRDGAAFHVDGALGLAPSFTMGRLFLAHPALRWISNAVYGTLPLAMVLVHVAERRTRLARRVDVVTGCVLLGLVGLSVYNACPVCGPVYLFPGFPGTRPALADVPYDTLLPDLSARNAIPSLHTGWALFLAMRAWRIGPGPRYATLAFLFVTLMATLGLGEHYLVDLVVAVPVTVAIDALICPEVPLDATERFAPIAVGSTLLVVWILIVRSFASKVVDIPGFIAGLMAVTVVLPLVLHARLQRLRTSADFEATPPTPEVARSATSGRTWMVGAMFFASGFAGLVYEVVFGKGLALAFGSTAQASVTVLATYMGGMALGAWLGGRLAMRRTNPLRVYAFAELGIAIWCALSPFMLVGARAVYVAIAVGQKPGLPIQSVIQLILGSAVLLPATVLMGVTMPVLARFVEEDEAGLARAVGLLYGANTFGAAAGALLTGYFVLPKLGVTTTTWFAVGLNVCVTLVGLFLAWRSDRAPAAAVEAPARGPVEAPLAPVDEEVAEAVDGESATALDRGIAVAVLAGGGAITLALEVDYTHLLAVVAGTSAYAFSSMLFSFLVGLGAGAAASRRALRGRVAKLWHVAALELCVAMAVLIGVYVWDAIPGYFASFADFPATKTFPAREFVRFSVCAIAMVPPAFFIGALYPAAIACAARGHARPAYALGRAAALNTAGNIVGAIGASFLLLPRYGALGTIHVLAGAAIVLGLLPLAARAGRSPIVGALALVGVLLFALNPRAFDLTTLATGANVYFAPQRDGTVIDSAESVSGGLTTVELSKDDDGDLVKTMLTNGKFQGDDSPNREARAQYAFALVPLLHMPQREQALVVGFGVGGSTSALRDAGFARVDVAELSSDVLDLAMKHFGRVNHGVLKDKHVHAYIADGRNFLLLHKGRYQLITIEISSIWFAGAANLYNREFYELAKAHLAPDGVFQQWVQLHHMSRRALVSILATVNEEFPHVWLYVTGSQGQIVACTKDCTPNASGIEALRNAAGLVDAMALFDGKPETLLDGRVLDGEGLERLLRHWPGDRIISTDDNLFLEYATPRGNALQGDIASQNFDFLTNKSKPRGRGRNRARIGGRGRAWADADDDDTGAE